MAHTVIRTDNLSGTVNPADLVSFRFYDSDGELAEVENGTIVELTGYVDGEYDVMKGVAATSSSNLGDCVITAGVEVMYDSTLRNLDDFINTIDKPIRGYIPRSRNTYSVTADGFVGGVVPIKGAEVGIGTGGKLDASGTGFGTCVKIESAYRYTYYVIRIGATEVVATTNSDESN